MVNKSALVRWAGPRGGYALARLLCRRQPRILMYHRFSPAPEPGAVSAAAFERQVAHIARHYHPVSMAALAAGLRGEAPLAPNTIAITVDDGYLDFYEIAFPILKRHGVPATLYATTGFVDGRTWLWPDQVAWLLDQLDQLPQAVQAGGFSAQAGPLAERRSAVWWGLVQALLKLPDVELRAWIRDFAAEHGLALPASAPPDCRAVSWEMLREMQAAGIEIGAHTQTHPSLGRVAHEAMAQEIAGSVRELDEHLGARPRAFCYPNGTPADCPAAAGRLAREAGCHSAVTAFYDRAGLDDLYALRRYAPAEDEFQFQKSVSGVEQLGSRLWGGNNIGEACL